MKNKDKRMVKMFEAMLLQNESQINGNLLYEEAQFNGTKVLTENVNGNTTYYIEGIFSEFDTKNQNGRSYPRSIMEPEIIRYFEKYVKTGRAFGELNHPSSSSIDFDNVSHRIINLYIKGNKVYGKAIIGGPKGDSVVKLLEMGGVVGVSSRSLGNMNHLNEVTELEIRTWDIVHEPSVSTAIMSSFNEAVHTCSKYDWLCDNTGFVSNIIQEEIKNINNYMLLDKEERELYAELQIKRFVESLIK